MKCYLSYLFTLILILSACSNNELNLQHSNEPEATIVELSASYSTTPQSRVGHIENEEAGLGETFIKYHWTLGDVIGVFTSSGTNVAASAFNIKRGSLAEDGSTAVFQGTLAGEITQSPIYAIYPIPGVNTNPANFEWNLVRQDYVGKLNESLACLSAISSYEYPDITEALRFKQQTAILNFNLSLPEGSSIYLDNPELVIESPQLYGKRFVDITTNPAIFKQGSIEPLTIALGGVKGVTNLKTKAYIFPNTIQNLKITLKDRTETGIRFYGVELNGERLVNSGELYSVTAQLKELELKPGDAEELPILITSKEELYAMAENVNSGVESYQGKYIRLENDIDLSGDVWIPIGNTENNPFRGFFDGNKKSIVGMEAKGGNLSGFFGKIYGGYLRDLRVEGTVTSTELTLPTGHLFIGGIAGKIDGKCILSGKLKSEVTILYKAETVHNVYAGGLFGISTPTASGGYHILAGTEFTYGSVDTDVVTKGIEVYGRSEIHVGGVFGRIEGGSWMGAAIFTNNAERIYGESAITVNKIANVAGLVGSLTGVNLESFEGHCNADLVHAKVSITNKNLANQITVGGLLGHSNAQNGFKVKEVASKTVLKGEGESGVSTQIWGGRATGAQGANAGNTQKQNMYNNEKMTSDNIFVTGGKTRYINGYIQN